MLKFKLCFLNKIHFSPNLAHTFESLFPTGFVLCQTGKQSFNWNLKRSTSVLEFFKTSEDFPQKKLLYFPVPGCRDCGIISCKHFFPLFFVCNLNFCFQFFFPDKIPLLIAIFNWQLNSYYSVVLFRDLVWRNKLNEDLSVSLSANEVGEQSFLIDRKILSTKVSEWR